MSAPAQLLLALVAAGGSAGIVATGGTVITQDGDYKVHFFHSAGTFTVVSGSGNAEILLVAGGGGGGTDTSQGTQRGGGGAGEIQYNAAYTLSAGTYAVTIGAGGIGAASSAVRGGPGGDTVFGAITAKGGGGGSSLSAPTGIAGGGSSGGTGNGNTPGTATIGSFSGWTGYANVGGAGSVGGLTGGGGGGGAGGAGGLYNGGPGRYFSISGLPVGFGGGGAGRWGTSPYTVGVASEGGGVSGLLVSRPNSGGGGGGADPNIYQKGATGIAIVRYASPAPVGTARSIAATDTELFNGIFLGDFKLQQGVDPVAPSLFNYTYLGG